jgi:hypothetical protein
MDIELGDSNSEERDLLQKEVEIPHTNVAGKISSALRSVKAGLLPTPYI